METIFVLSFVNTTSSPVPTRWGNYWNGNIFQTTISEACISSPHSLGKLLEWKLGTVLSLPKGKIFRPHSLGKLLEWKPMIRLGEGGDQKKSPLAGETIGMETQEPEYSHFASSKCPHSLGKLLEWKPPTNTQASGGFLWTSRK